MVSPGRRLGVRRAGRRRFGGATTQATRGAPGPAAPDGRARSGRAAWVTRSTVHPTPSALVTEPDSDPLETAVVSQVFATAGPVPGLTPPGPGYRLRIVDATDEGHCGPSECGHGRGPRISGAVPASAAGAVEGAPERGSLGGTVWSDCAQVPSSSRRRACSTGGPRRLIGCTPRSSPRVSQRCGCERGASSLPTVRSSHPAEASPRSTSRST